VFGCRSCGRAHEEKKPRCDGCGAWDTVIATRPKGVRPLSEIKTERIRRTSLGVPELNGFYGGGLVPASRNLISGPPGWGKSTLLIQIANLCGEVVWYASSEETGEEIALRAKRLGIRSDAQARLLIQETKRIEDVTEAMEHDRHFVKLLMIDSIHEITSDSATGDPGSTSQVMAVMRRLESFQKETGIPSLILGHVNKNGDMAGTRAAEHVATSTARLRRKKDLRHFLSGGKNRHGATEVDDSIQGKRIRSVTFRMTERGLLAVPSDDACRRE
jgi:DNA repair protein RadA/Sms